MTLAPADLPLIIPGLEINTVEDGYVVHQAELGQVHYLNATAAVVLELCNGLTSATDLPRLVQEAYGLAEPPVEDVAACLTTLREACLIR